ncbi:MAG: efflux RND transporter permease subunit [Myxococcota bacterium]
MSDLRERLIDPLEKLLLEHPRWVVVSVALLFALSLLALVDLRSGEPRLRLDPSVDGLLPEDDPGRQYLERIQALFDSGDVVLIGLSSDDAFTRERLARLEELSEAIESEPEVLYVSSLSTAVHIRGENGALRVGPFFEDVPETPAELADLRERALADPIYAGNLISRDGRVAVVAAQLLDVSEEALITSRFDERIRALAEAAAGDAEVWITGAPHIQAEIARLLRRDIQGVLPIAYVVMALAAFVAFRSWRGVAIPMLTVGVAVTATMACMAEISGSLNQVTSAVPSILVVVGFAYAVHLLAAYEKARRAGEGDSRALVHGALRETAIPVFFTGVTTAAGFLTLTTSSLHAVQQFGFYNALGVGLTTLFALTLVPALLRLLPVSSGAVTPSQTEPDRFDRWLSRVAQFDLRRRSTVLLSAAVLAAAALIATTRIEVGTSLVSSLSGSNPSRIDFEAFNQHLQGANGFRVVLEAREPDAFKDPVSLRAVDDLTSWLLEQPEIGGVTSLADYVKTIHRGVDGEAAFRIPDSAEAVSQLLILGENEELQRFVVPDYSVANLEVRTSAIDSSALVPLVHRIQTRLDELPGSLAGQVTGNTVLVAQTLDEIAVGQLRSLGTAFVIIYLILSFLFTSFRIGLVALIPNALPVLVYFGLLGLSGVSLNVTTGLVACLVLGIVVDDTIHLMAHFNEAAKRMADERRGVLEAVVAVGRPITYTTIALCLGFLCLLASGNANQFEFGLLSAATLAIAWVIDITLTPAIAGRLRVVTLWDVLRLDLGEAPQRSIPVFKGLTERQARIAALMASFRPFRAGDCVVADGTLGDEMFVVIDGELEASVGSGPTRTVLRTMRRGDLIGEVGLVLGRRSADVVAMTDGRLLRLTREDLDRLSRRYPRIAAILNGRLSEVLAMRLVSLTGRVGSATETREAASSPPPTP